MNAMMQPPFELDDQWILAQRGAKNSVSPERVYHALVEEERTASGAIEAVATLFLSNSECPFRCLMCDLWQNTLSSPTPAGAIPLQIRAALSELPPAQHIKLYNSGNFFDRKAVPPQDIPAIADLVHDFKTVIVENHPLLTDERCLEFADRLNGQLEVAIGLETVHPQVFPRLNKRCTLADYRRAVNFLVQKGIRVRTFILLPPPFLELSEGILWAQRSIDFAFDCGVECCAIIPTRTGNGALDALRRAGAFARPDIRALEQVTEYGIRRGHGRVFADLWDLGKFSTCSACFAARAARLHRMNLEQRIPEAVDCEFCAAER